MGWLFGDAQKDAGITASHTRNSCTIARLTTGAQCFHLTTLLQKPPFLRRLHHHGAQTGPCVAVPCIGGHGELSAVIAASHGAQTLWASSEAEAHGPP